MIKKIIQSSNNISRDCYLWNMISSLLFGFQSVLILVVLTRTAGLADSGIFTLAYAVASLFLYIGKYGVRNYQVSDVSYEHSFQEYRIARYLSISVMVLCTILYIIYGVIVNQYTWQKSMVILLVCLYKVPDALEDVYFGEYQRKGRLDIAEKAMSVRLGVSIAALCLMLVITGNLIVSLLVAVSISFLSMQLLIKWTVSLFPMDYRLRWHSVRMVMKACFPLFTGFFLSQYIGNAPKYAIDMNMSDEMQACYGFISMPVFVIGLLSNIIYSPILHRMADYWMSGKVKLFLRRFLLQAAIVIGITSVCLVGAYFVGIPVLSLFYDTDLSAYKSELLILLSGGGFLALAGLLNITITIMRFQYHLLIGYAVVSLIALLCSDKVVNVWGMRGAAWIYTILMGLLFGIFIILFIIGLWKVCKTDRK